MVLKENFGKDLKWRNVEVTKMGPFLQNYVGLKLNLSKNVNTKILSPNLIFLKDNHFQQSKVFILKIPI